jgi:hypothetical protein
MGYTPYEWWVNNLIILAWKWLIGMDRTVISRIQSVQQRSHRTIFLYRNKAEKKGKHFCGDARDISRARVISLRNQAWCGGISELRESVTRGNALHRQ